MWPFSKKGLTFALVFWEEIYVKNLIGVHIWGRRWPLQKQINLGWDSGLVVSVELKID